MGTELRPSQKLGSYKCSISTFCTVYRFQLLFAKNSHVKVFKIKFARVDEVCFVMFGPFGEMFFILTYHSYMRALRQTFLLTAGIIVAVDQSVKQETTNFTCVIKSINTHKQNMFHRTLLITIVSIVL
jgi:hypothetical protein